MTNEELKKLNRAELLELLLDQVRLNEKLKQDMEAAEKRYTRELEEANAKLETREINIREAGSIAQAALSLNEVFEKADSAAKQYLDNAIAQADLIVKEATELAEKKKAEADSYWNVISQRMERFYQEHAQLREMLDAKVNDAAQRSAEDEKENTDPVGTDC